jgi:PPOX class probable F420-dependent enzyme
MSKGKRAQIELTEEEQRKLLAQERVVVVATFGPRGWPHLMPLWYMLRDGDVWVWTYAKSQKVRNLERDPRATLLVETGHEYGELRGVMIEAEAELIRDTDRVLAFGVELTARYFRDLESAEGDRELEQGRALAASAPKRVLIRFRPKRIASWDHRKLGGGY